MIIYDLSNPPVDEYTHTHIYIQVYSWIKKDSSQLKIQNHFSNSDVTYF